MTRPRPPALALVQHGHQYLVTDGYDNHEGISDVLDGFTAVLSLHLEHEVALNLHLSGTLIEAIAWHRPRFFDQVRALWEAGLVEMIGSGYSQSILTLFSPAHNLRQLNETLALYRRHLGVDPAEVRGFWVPERVWSTDRLAPLLRSDRLLNGGYDWVLLDDRLTYSTVNGQGRLSDRHSFDLGSSPARGSSAAPGGPRPTAHLRPYRIEGSGGLAAVPISGELRYAVPPRHDGHWEHLRGHLAGVAAAGPGALAVYGDDLEKSAGVGPWAPRPWRRDHVAAYEQLLGSLSPAAASPAARPVRLSAWLADHPAGEQRAVDPGTFFELARAHGAGEDYLGWWNGGAWAPYRRHLVEAEQLLTSRAGSSPLWELAWKQLMACSYETAWHDTMGAAPQGPAPWARAVASHARSVFVIAAAAEWAERLERPAGVDVTDIDRDGHDEVVLRNEHVFAVVTPAYGGRLLYLFDLDLGCLVVGNPADDWNWQEELNRFMEVPRNHPGAFADTGHENDRWDVIVARALGGTARGVEAVLGHVRGGSMLQGSLKVFRLEAGGRHIEVAYRLAYGAPALTVEWALSPDYLTLLREGRSALRPLGEGRRRGCRSGAAEVWVELPEGEPVAWDPEPGPGCGHGHVLRAVASEGRFTVRLGLGAGVEVDLRERSAEGALEANR